MITFQDILSHYGVEPKNVKFVRHGNIEIPILETFQNDRKHFEIYQSFQSPVRQIFKGAKHIAVFAPGHHTSGIFLGLWDVIKYIENKDLKNNIHNLIEKYYQQLVHTCFDVQIKIKSFSHT